MNARAAAALIASDSARSGEVFDRPWYDTSSRPPAARTSPASPATTGAASARFQRSRRTGWPLCAPTFAPRTTATSSPPSMVSSTPWPISAGRQPVAASVRISRRQLGQRSARRSRQSGGRVVRPRRFVCRGRLAIRVPSSRRRTDVQACRRASVFSQAAHAGSSDPAPRRLRWSRSCSVSRLAIRSRPTTRSAVLRVHQVPAELVWAAASTGSGVAISRSTRRR